MLDLMGRSLNVISLAGLAFAVGMLVDNAVVVLENIYRHYQLGKRPREAAVVGTQEVYGAVLASTLTTLAVFVPVLFVQEEAGQLFRDIALAISSAVGLSLIVSVTVISTATSRILKDRGDSTSAEGSTSEVPPPKRGVLDRIGGGFVDRIVGLNRWVLGGSVRQVIVVLAFVGASVLGTLAMSPKVEYLPTGNRNLVFGILLPPPGYNLDQLLDMGERIETALEPYWNVEPGSPEAAKLDGPMIGDFFYVAFGRRVFLGLRAVDPLRAPELVPLIKRVGRGIPGTFAVAKQSSLFEQGLSAGRTIDIEITGPDLEVLVGLGGRIIGAAAQAVPDAQLLPKPSLDLSNPEVHVRPRWDRAAEMGIDARRLGYGVNALVDGAYATDYFMAGEKIDLTIQGQARFAQRTQDLEELPFATPGGALVPLRAIADIELGSGPEQVNRRERQRTITIEVSPPQEMPLEEAMQRITEKVVQPLMDEGALPPLYHINLAGTADKLKATWSALSFNVLMALLITYLLMAALFESWLYPFVIILSVPLGAVGGFGGLRLLNQFVSQPLDVLTMLGFVILIGTVVNNAILIVHQSLNNMREQGLSPHDAVLESVRTRIRPIFMTTTTTVFGLLPLVVSPGAGSELYRGLGSVLLGGMVVSAAFTLILVPALFTLTLGAKSRVASVLSR
jgi:HAE1 family hydrophobic/amphiphilic exporter-1